MTDERTPLWTQVEPEITDARIARQWAAMEGRGLPGPSRRGGWLLATAYAVPLMAAIAVFAWYGTPWTSPWGTQGLASGAAIDAEEPISLRLRDGSSVELAAQTRLRMLRDQADAVEVELASGRATFDVTHVEGRKFTVSLGRANVRVVGTRFEVVRSDRNEGALLSVSVSRGIVEVRRSDQPGSVRRLTAGETWSALVPSAAAVATAAPPVAQPSAPAASAEPGAATDEEAEADVEESGETEEPATEPEPHATRGNGVSRAARAHALFQHANLARRAGQMRDAETGYADLLRRYPRDGRAGVAAFELGRIRMDALGNPQGAVSAFRRALKLSPDASFREDALARIVVAYDAMGRTAECNAARERYLAGFPHGVHAASLAARCK
jgi:transmembrane sensor